VTSFGKPGKWQRAMMVATGIGVLGASFTAPLAEAAMLAPSAQHAAFWLQDNAQTQPSQVGEGDSDTETLDQGSPTATETLDQGSPPATSGDDVETLDQGQPPTGAVPVPVAEGTVLTTAPVTTDMAYAEPAGPRLPPGFGEGRVMVSNNPRGFPVGLEPCEVGVVSGRAYVGVNCGEDSSPVVGHSTYDNFPWVIDPGFPFEPGADVVTDPSFPFDEDSPFFESTLDRTTDSDVVVLVAPRAFPFNDDDDNGDTDSTEEPVISTGGVVSMTQPARAGKERNRERTRSTGSASSGDVSSDPGKSHTRRSAAKKQRANVSSESKRGKNSGGKHGNKAKANKNKKKDHKNANKDSKKQRAKSEKKEKREKRNKTK
jgi:hypothetical protein